MIRSSYKIATVWGIPIRLDATLLLAAFLLTSRFGLTTGLLLTVGLILSIVLHELGHSWLALRYGCRVRDITMTCLGGAATMEAVPTRPLEEFLMAVAGPAVSLVLGLAGVFGGPHLPLPVHPRYGLNVVELAGVMNFFLLGFNLLPAFPMDGGRILRAALTPRLGRLRATAVAARLGRVLAVLFGFHGVFSGNWILVFIAFFVFIAAGREYEWVRMQEAERQGGFPFSSIFGAPDPRPPEDRVEVSPPPYARGRGTRADLHREDSP